MVMSTLDHAVRTLESPDEFVQFLENVGQSHNRIPGFKRDYFWVSFIFSFTRTHMIVYCVRIFIPNASLLSFLPPLVTVHFLSSLFFSLSLSVSLL